MPHAAYWRAIRYAMDRHDEADKKESDRTGRKPRPIARFTPHQIRHTVATMVRTAYGLEGSQVYLCHASTDATQLYAEQDAALATRIARDLG